MAIDKDFEELNVRRAEMLLLRHVVAREHFVGELYDRSGHRLGGMTLERLNGELLDLDEVTIGRLFMIPDGATSWALCTGEKPDAPAGLDIRSTCPFFAEDEQNSVVVFRDETDTGMLMEDLYVRRMMLAESAPKRMGTVAFGLMAVTAYRLGFGRIGLFAAGCGPLLTTDGYGFIGYHVWPKFGFDAPVEAVELNRDPVEGLAACHSVQDILALAPAWWASHGTARMMEFDLTAGSRSWSILLHYLYDTLVERQP